MKRRISAIAILAWLAVVSLQAAFYAEEQLPVGASAVGFSASKISPAGLPVMTVAQCRLELAQIRYWFTGATPTASVGTLWEAGEYVTFNQREDIVNFKAIRTTSVSGQLDCQYKGN